MQFGRLRISYLFDYILFCNVQETKLEGYLQCLGLNNPTGKTVSTR